MKLSKKEQIKKDRDTINEVLGTLSSEQYDDKKRVNMKTLKETMKSLNTKDAPKKLHISGKVSEYASIRAPKSGSAKPRVYVPEKSKQEILKDKAATRQYSVTKNGKMVYGGLSQVQANDLVRTLKKSQPNIKYVVKNVSALLTEPTTVPINE